MDIYASSGKVLIELELDEAGSVLIDSEAEEIVVRHVDDSSSMSVKLGKALRQAAAHRRDNA